MGIRRKIDEANNLIYIWCDRHLYGGRGVPENRRCKDCLQVYYTVFVCTKSKFTKLDGKQKAELIERVVRRAIEHPEIHIDFRPEFQRVN